LPPPQGQALAELVAEHYEQMLVEYGAALGVRVARKHLDWYLEGQGIVLDRDLRTRLLGSEAPAEVLALIRDIFAGGWRDAA
jgi:tRNA-dihydrouridine synthase B